MDERMPRTIVATLTVIVTLDDEDALVAHARLQPVAPLLGEDDPAKKAVGLLLPKFLKPLPGTRVDLVRADVE